MANGEIISALRTIEKRGFTITGSPSKILRATGYDGSWVSFMNGLPDGCITKDPKNTNKWIITHPDKPSSEDSVPIVQFDINKWTDAAVDYVLGEENQPTIVDYQGKYGEHMPIIGALACKIDDRIASTFYPPKTDEPAEIYRDVRGLYFTADTQTFYIFGCVSIDEIPVAS